MENDGLMKQKDKYLLQVGSDTSSTHNITIKSSDSNCNNDSNNSSKNKSNVTIHVEKLKNEQH